MKLTLSNNAASLAVAYLYENLKPSLNGVTVEKGDQLSLEVDKNTNLKSMQTIARYLATKAKQFYGNTIDENTEIDHWLDYANNTIVNGNFDTVVSHLNAILATKDYLVGNRLTIADFAVFSALKSKSALKNDNGNANLFKYFNQLENNRAFQVSVSVQVQKSEPKDYSKEGKFIELPGAEKGKVVVRFPPEASGYLHVGHAKAALLNQYYQKEFEGKMIFRFDDTNPAKENHLFEQVILEDVKLLGCEYQTFSRTSDHFELLLKYCEQMIKEGKAYADDTEPEEMKNERDKQIESKNRNNSVEKNLKMWEEMKKGTEYGQKCCIRAKIDMKSANGTMRDPTLYRCKPEPHVVTGDKYKVYPTYDFACPIVDSVEGVTHALRTTEYHDRDEQYMWIIDALGLRKPYIYEYSRFNLQHTVLSKRRLTWFVDNKKVNGWDDPRFPTVRGILRHGMTVEALKQFIIAQGSSRSVVTMEWDKIWTINKQIIDGKAPRHSAVLKDKTVVVNVADAKEESKPIPKHPKNPEVGTKTVWYGPKILIDEADALTINEGELVTFMDWGNLQITKINKKGDKIESIDAILCLDNKDFKKTTKLTWLAQTSKAPLTPATCIHYDHIIAKAILDKDEDFKDYCTHQTQFDFNVLGDPELKNLKKGDVIQIQRRGYYICDQPAEQNKDVVLIYIPDGSKKESPTSYMSITNQTYFTSAQENQKQEKTTEKQPNQKQEKAAKSNAQPAKASAATSSSTVASSSSGSADSLSQRIKAAGDVVRDLKAKKASKEDIDKEVKLLLQLKGEYKTLTGKDWTPDAAAATSAKPAQQPAPASAAASSSAVASSGNADALSQQIKAAGDTVRDLKAKKAPKDQVDKEVKVLLQLKGEYKTLTGKDWTPEAVAAAPAKPAQQPATASAVASASTVASSTSGNADAISQQIKAVGDTVRDLKAKKAPKDQIDKEVKTLLQLKGEYKTLTGKDWTPEAAAASSTTSVTQTQEKQNTQTTKMSNAQGDAESLNDRIKKVGDGIRDLKSKKASKDEIDKEVKVLLQLKADYKALTGKDWQPEAGSASAAAASNKENKKPAAEEKKQKETKTAAAQDDGAHKKETRLCIEAKKEENLADWYSELITKAELIEYYDVSGCYILRPWAYFIWEQIKAKFDAEIRKLGVQNCYFPLFVSKAALEREKTHIADFAPEVAWVTKSGQSDLAEPIAIRPTSETVMYPSYAKWIQSYRDLPLKLNQWNNVVRWEFKHPQPFLRTREFLWQEGHTAFSNYEEAEKEVYQILDLYADVYKSLLAIPVIKGRKTEKEKFAGADWTTTIEAYISASGRGIQAATSHHLGQNFSKMFDISFEHPETKAKTYAYQNSWGLTTRTIGILNMVHGDNTGLILPPAVACYQVVIVPCGITAQLSKDDEKKLIDKCKWYEQILNEAGVRVYGDYRDNVRPGWKFNHWELKGVPLRLEIGPKDIAQKKFVAVRRDTGDKLSLDEDKAVAEIKKLFEDIHNHLYTKAEKDLKAHLTVEDTWDGFLKAIDAKKLIMAPFCGGKDCEGLIKGDSARDAVVEEGAPAMGAKSLCIPFDQPKKITDQKCVHPKCGAKAQYYTLFGRSY